jgi:hypothetical protein
MAKPNKPMRDFWIFKAPMNLKLALDRVRIERIRIGKDNQLRSYKRLGLAISRHEKLLNDIINADFIDNDK